MTEAVCTVAPEWWGAGLDEQSDQDLAMWGCRICPVTDCLKTFAESNGRVERTADLGKVVIDGLYGRRLMDAVNRIAPDTRVRRLSMPAPCGTDRGYMAHRRRGVAACDACREAHRDANARRAMRRAS